MAKYREIYCSEIMALSDPCEFEREKDQQYDTNLNNLLFVILNQLTEGNYLPNCIIQYMKVEKTFPLRSK